MRTAPQHVTDALTAYDADTRVIWKPEMERWMLCWRDRELFTLSHCDGVPMLSLDGYTDEVLWLVRRCDNYVDGPDRLRAMRRSAAERRYRAEQKGLVCAEEARRESEQVIDVMDKGVSPFLPPMTLPTQKTEEDTSDD